MVVCFWLFLHITDVPADEDTVCFWLVGMCVVGLLFENYIVNASIFIRSNFLEIIEPGSDMTLSGVVTVFMVLSISFLISLCGQVFKGTRWMPWH